MNIFVTSSSPYFSAIALDDRRLIKMILETAQLLSTAVRETPNITLTNSFIYKSTHANHPCAIWARASQDNFFWLCRLGAGLSLEYLYRFRRVHASSTIIECVKNYLEFIPQNRPIKCPKESEFVNCTPYKHLPVFEAYKQTLRDKWQADGDRAKWTNSQPPEWK